MPTEEKYLDALRHIGIKVRQQYKWGAKSKTNGIEFYVRKLSDEGLTAKQISQKLDISLNRVYYLLKKSDAKFDNRKRKYNHDEVKQLKKEGLSAKEISQKLDIPIRTVYYILNNK